MNILIIKYIYSMYLSNYIFIKKTSQVPIDTYYL